MYKKLTSGYKSKPKQPAMSKPAEAPSSNIAAFRAASVAIAAESLANDLDDFKFGDASMASADVATRSTPVKSGREPMSAQYSEFVSRMRYHMLMKNAAHPKEEASASTVRTFKR